MLKHKAELQITAPVNGVIEALELQKGDLVAANAPVLSVMDDENLWVRVYVPEDRLDSMDACTAWMKVA